MALCSVEGCTMTADDSGRCVLHRDTVPAPPGDDAVPDADVTPVLEDDDVGVDVGVTVSWGKP